MILVISTCENPLAEHEFVRPVTDIISAGGEQFARVHYTHVTGELLRSCDKIIICGTQLKDEEYLKHLSMFSWVKENQKPLLGICAGMQAIAMQYGARLVKQDPEIGMTRVKVTRDNPLISKGEISAYALHSFSVTIPAGFVKIAESKKCVHGIMHKEKQVYGLLFHPEVRNKRVIERFINL